MVAALAFAAAWLGYDQWRTSGGHAIAWRDRSADLRSAEFARPATRVFRSRRDLRRFLATALPAQPIRTPHVDFERRLALLVAAGPRSSTGYSLTIARAEEERGRLVVEVRERAPRLGDRVRARVTYPVLFVLLPVTAKPVHVEWLGRP